MHCPKCGQEQASDQTRFCSRCGFSLTGVAMVVANDGEIPLVGVRPPASNSPKRRGVMQGLFIFLLSFLIVPILAVISIALNAEPIAVFLALFLLVVGGMLRAAYALMFEEGAAQIPERADLRQFERNSGQRELSAPAASLYSSPTTGKWRDTNDLSPEPASVTDSTTKLLERDQ